MDSVAGAVSFENVTFQYDDADAPALQDVTLDVRSGETVAFVGPSGSGKSTILNMVIGFLAPTSGTIRIDGNSVSDIDLRSYRRFMAVVPQESLLFEEVSATTSPTDRTTSVMSRCGTLYDPRMLRGS